MLRLLTIVFLLCVYSSTFAGIYVHHCRKLEKDMIFLGKVGCTDSIAEPSASCCKKNTPDKKTKCNVEYQVQVADQNISFAQITPLTAILICFYRLHSKDYSPNYFIHQASINADISPPLLLTSKRYKFIQKFSI